MLTPNPLARLTVRLLLPGVLLLLAACGSRQEPPPPAAAFAPASSDATEALLTPSAEVQILLPPPTPGDETPLQLVASVPPTVVITQTQSKSELAAMLHTTVEQLEYANVGLEDPVTADTLIVVPSGYRVVEEETLADIAASTGIAEADLRQANGLGDGNIPLSAGTTLKLPPQKVVQKDVTLADLAAAIGVPPERLLEANPQLAQSDIVAAGTLIILPAVNP